MHPSAPARLVPAAVLLTALLPAAAPAAPPDVVAGPDLAATARVVEAPVSEVTVFSDRARVRREARLDLPAGPTTVRLPDLPGAVLMDTVRVEAKGARVLRIETTPVERERLQIDQVETLITRLEDLHRQVAEVDGRMEVLAAEVQLLDRAQPGMPVPEPEREGRVAPTPQVGTWRAALGFVQARREAALARQRELSRQRRDLEDALERVRREVARHDLGAFTDRKVQVVAIVQTKKARKASLALEYFVPGASWHPSYELHFEPSVRKVTLKTGGLVRQASGEDWTGVRLALSTAIPGQSIALPELLTWTLGEKRDFVPVPRPERRQARAARHPPPQPKPIASEAERAARQEALRGRLARLNQLAAMAPGQGIDTGIANAGRGSIGAAGSGGYGVGSAPMATGSLSAKRKAERAPRPRMSRRPAPAPSAASDYDFEDEEVTGELTEAAGSRRERKRGERVVRTSLALLEPGAWRPPSFSDPTLPAVLAGGLDYVYESPTPATIPSTGEALLVPLAAETWPAKTRYEATPSLSKTAYLSAEVENRGERPILQGPVTIFSGGDFVGDGRLETTGPGGTIRLPLGADEDIRIVRTVVPETRTDGLLKKTEETVYTTTIEIGNYEKRAVELVILDQIPKTNNEDIEVRLVDAAPAAAEGPDGKGLLTWRLKVPAGKTTTIRFQYAIRRPADWQLIQR